MTEQFWLDRDRGRLFSEGPKLLDPSARRWVETPKVHGELVTLRDAVRWLQHASGTPCRAPIAVIGPRDASDAERIAAFALGAGLGDLGLTLICGGKTGVMEAACAGAASVGGLSIGVLPESEWEGANRFVTVPIATGIGEARNAVIARAPLALVAVGNSYGTLSEIALGLQFGRPVFTLPGAAEIAGSRAMASPEHALAAVCRIALALPH